MCANRWLMLNCECYRVERQNCRPRKDDMIPFPFNENWFSFFVADHLLVGQLCTNFKSDRSLLSCLKVTPCSTSEIGDAPLYNTCSLPIQVMTTGPLPASSKCKSGRFNAWGHSSTHRITLWRWWSGKTPPGNPDQGVHREGPGNHWWDSPAVYSTDCLIFKRLTHNCECMYERGLEVSVLQAPDKPDLDWEDKEPQANQVRQAPSSPTWTHWTTSFGHTSRTLSTWPPTTPKLAWSPPSTEYSASSRQRLWKRHAPSSRSVSRRWLRLKAATLNSQLYYIIKLPELIFPIKVLK